MERSSRAKNKKPFSYDKRKEKGELHISKLNFLYQNGLKETPTLK